MELDRWGVHCRDRSACSCSYSQESIRVAYSNPIAGRQTGLTCRWRYFWRCFFLTGFHTAYLEQQEALWLIDWLVAWTSLKAVTQLFLVVFPVLVCQRTERSRDFPTILAMENRVRGIPSVYAANLSTCLVAVFALVSYYLSSLIVVDSTVLTILSR